MNNEFESQPLVEYLKLYPLEDINKLEKFIKDKIQEYSQKIIYMEDLLQMQHVKHQKEGTTRTQNKIYEYEKFLEDYYNKRNFFDGKKKELELFMATPTILDKKPNHQMNNNQEEQSSHIEQLLEELAKLKVEKERIINQYTGYQEKIDSTRSELSKAEGQLNFLTIEKQRVESEVYNLNAKIEAIREDYPQLDYLSQLKLDIGQAQQDKFFLEGEIGSLRSNLQELRSREQDLLTLAAQIESKNIDLARLSSWIEKERNTHDQLQTKIQEAERSKLDLTHRIQSLEAEGKHLEEQNLRQRQSQEIIQSGIRQLEIQLQQLQAKHQICDLEYEHLQKKKEELQGIPQQLESLKLQLSDRAAQANVLSQQIHDLEEKREELNQLKVSIASYQKDVEHQEQLVSQLEQEKNDLERQSHALKEALQGIPQQLESLNRQLSERTAQNNELKQQTHELEERREELNQLKVNIASYQKDIENKQQLAISLQQRKDELEPQLQQLNERIRLINEANPNYEQREELIREIAGLRLEHIQIEEERKAEQNKKDRLLQEIEDLEIKRQEKIRLESELLSLQKEYQKLNERIPELSREVSGLESLRQNYDELLEQRNHLQATVDGLRPEIQGLEEQKQQILNAIRDQEQEYQRLEERRNDLRILERQLQETSNEVARQRREANQLRGQVDELERKSAAITEKNKALTKINSDLEHKNKEIKRDIAQSQDEVRDALQALETPLWSNLPQQKRIWDSETMFLGEFENHLLSQGFAFHERVLRAFHTSLKIQDISSLVILAGISGTGKSQLPQQYADFIGAEKITLPVQPRWDSPQDLQGFYNYIEKKYKPTELTKGLWQYEHQKDHMSDRMIIVLLDEMNLAKVEYYFSDFLSKLENRSNCYLNLDFGSIPIGENKRRLRIPPEFLFVGTMNEDETTQSLSDKVLDRANILTFGRPEALKLKEENQGFHPAISRDSYLPYTGFLGWNKRTDPSSDIVKQIKGDFLDKANRIMESLGHPFAHRVYQAITRYVINYPGVIEGNTLAFNASIADQFGQKLLPKLRGIMVEDNKQELNELSALIENLNDPALQNAFENAQNVSRSYGQFQWRGLIYKQEEE
ncbi:MAG: AAA domain-containing protein [Synechococcaceae cyanobacterium SM2_3_1]|nr:AAA domain-containing protein [Synechococcaceae cyanobacterium SM2_3_1]